MLIYKPYTYLIGWSSLNKFYYGVEYSISSKIANPQNLWTLYFTSSNYVKEIREEFGEPDIIQIRRTFNNANEAISWEKKVLRRMNVIYRDDFINKSDSFNHLHPAWNKGLTKKDSSKLSGGRKKGCITWNKGIKVPFRNRPNKNPEQAKLNISQSLRKSNILFELSKEIKEELISYVNETDCSAYKLWKFYSEKYETNLKWSSFKSVHYAIRNGTF